MSHVNPVHFVSLQNFKWVIAFDVHINPQIIN